MKARFAALALVAAVALYPRPAESWGTLTGKINIPAQKEAFIRGIMIPNYAIDGPTMSAQLEDRRGPHPIHQFLVYQAFLRLSEDPAYKDGNSGFPTGAHINAWDGVAHTDHGMAQRSGSWQDNRSPSMELGPDIEGIGGPSADAEIVADMGWNAEYNGRAHYWNPYLHAGEAPVTAAANYTRLVRAIVEGADDNTKAHYASYMSHYLADVASAKHADAFTLDPADLERLLPLAKRFMDERTDVLVDWMGSGAIDEAEAVLRARTRTLNPATSGAYWQRVDGHIEANQLFLGGEHTLVAIYPKNMRAAVGTYLHELANRPEGKSIDQFFTYFDPFYFNGHIFNRPGDWPSFELASPTSDHLQWETNPAHYVTAMKYMGDEPTVMPLKSSAFGRFRPEAGFYAADWSEALYPMEETVEELVKACSEEAHGAITLERDFQDDPSHHMETAIRYLYTAYRASITALRVEATARKIGETDSFRLKCTVRNLSDEPADLRSLRLLIKGADGTFSSLPGWTFDVGGKRVTNAKPHVVTVVGKGLPDGVSLDELYVDLRGEVRGVPDSGWRRSRVGETEFKIVRNPRAGTDLVKKGGPVDVIVVLDTTGSMQGSIDSMRENAIRSIQRLQTITTDIRMAITTFRDLKDEDGSSHFVVKGFTLELENQYNFLRSLDADGGGDTPEDQLHGISLGLALWEKEGARTRVPTKVVIVITDAPAKSPDSHGNTFKSIAKRAFEVDPAHIYPIVVGTNSTALEHAQELADSSGGKVLTAATADKVADAILEAVETAVAEHGVEEPGERTPLGLVAMFVVGSVAFLFGAITLLGTLRR